MNEEQKVIEVENKRRSQMSRNGSVLFLWNRLKEEGRRRRCSDKEERTKRGGC